MTGDTHGYNELDPNEDEVVKILKRRNWNVNSVNPDLEYLVELRGYPDQPLWYSIKDLACPDLIQDFDVSDNADRLEHYKGNFRTRRRHY
jgi:hypothetical protein